MGSVGVAGVEELGGSAGEEVMNTPVIARAPNGFPARFLQEHVSYDDPNSCLLWPYARARDGYAKIRWNGVAIIASRVMCELAHGPAPTPEHEAAHSCGNGAKGCVNQHHLRWATSKENKEDSMRFGTISHGEQHYAAKLTEGDVLEIRRLADTKDPSDLAAQFGVSQRTISNIVLRQRWKHI